jgi:serine/threonine-protein kinase
MSTLHTGDRVANRYRLDEPVGRGGMARVFRAHDEVLDRAVAVKIVDKQPNDETFGQACIAEARAAAALAHPNIARVFDSGVHEGCGFIVIELVAGRTLRAILDERRVLPPPEAIELAAQVADALDCAHRHGVIHCDVKPPNIIVAPDGCPKLVDFGIARAMAATTDQAEEIWGSASYMAPEQVEGLRPDGRTDIYALGVVLYEMLAGRLPYEGETIASVVAQRLTRDPPPLRQQDPGIAPAIERIVLRALARERTGRHASAGELRDALRGVAQQAATRTSPLPAATSPSRPHRAAPAAVRRLRGRRPVSVFVLVTLALLGLLLLGLVVASPLRSAIATQQATVPDLTDKRIGEVPALLEQAHLVAGPIEVRPADASQVGYVLEQRPSAGATLASGGEVGLVVGVPR